MKTIVLTGCTRGLGRAMTEYFCAGGHRLAGCGRSNDAIRALAQEFTGQDFCVVDVADDMAVAQWAGHVLKKLGPPDLLINNAAVIARNAPLWKVPREEFDRVIDVNIKGTANVIRHFLPAMMERGSGVVVNFSSGWGRSASPEVAAYCASKWAIEGLTRALAQELPHGLAAVALNPGIIDTDMLLSCFGAGAEGYPGAGEWIRNAGRFLLKLGPSQNGQALTVPGIPVD